MTRSANYLGCMGVLMAIAMSTSARSAESAFFQQEVLPDEGARVKAERNLPQRTWDQACRSVLLEPLRLQYIEQLERQLEVELEGHGAYVSASIDGYRSYRDGGWLYCSAATVTPDDSSSLAGTALREAWQGLEHYDRQTLVQLLKAALRHPETYDDGLVLVAKTMDTSKQVQFLDDNLDPTKLKLAAAFESAFEVWLKHERFETVLQFEKGCDTVKCRELIVQARNLKEKEDAEKVYDLSSYF